MERDNRKLVAMLVRHERLRLVVYDDATGKPIGPGSTLIGHPSVGFGRCLDKHGISKAEAFAFLDADIEWAIDGCAQNIASFHELSPVRQDVLISMAFNMGIQGLIGFRKMLVAIEREDWDVAAFEMLSSAWSKQVGNRALELSRMMATGHYP